jgi:MFS family permease
MIFGFTFLGIISLTLSTVGKLYGRKATQVMAQLTLGYCIAQILSPIFSGILAEATGSFAMSLYIISAIMIIGMFCLFALRSEHQELAAYHKRPV